MRPKVWLNCAISLDGRLAGKAGVPVRLSDDLDLRRVHQIRAGADAILVGVQTIINDDPSLRVKWDLAEVEPGEDPLRVVLDTNGRTPSDARILTDGGPTVIFVGPGSSDNLPDDKRRTVPAGLDLEAVMDALAQDGVKTLMVEGGAKVLRSFIEAGTWDRFTVYQAPVILGEGPSLWSDVSEQLGRGVAQVHGEGVLWNFSPGS